MTHANWFAPETIQALGWTLLHFVWQGSALALLLFVLTAFCKSARTRYAIALSTLVAMAACPVATLIFLQHREAEFDFAGIKDVVRGVAVIAGTQPAFSGNSIAPHDTSVDWLGWCVAGWFIGVLVFGARALGGCIVIERLRREKIEPLSENVRRMCITLQQRLCVRQSVQYFQSRVVDSPAVIGWFRPVVLLPLTVLTGLSPQQLEAVILHELAHIKRWDSFVNLFQITVETILFYHPAVWWVSRSIRTERENCCDDIAVSICGNAGEYARALALLESWRATPALAMAVTGGALKARIARLIGFEKLSAGVPRAGLAAVGLICAGSALLAASEFRAVYLDVSDSGSSVTEPTKPTEPEVTKEGWPRAEAKNVDQAEVAQEPVSPQPPEPASTSAPHTGSYIEDLHAVGLANLTIDQLIALKVQGVTADYVRRLHDAGLHPDVEQLIAMKVQGISPEYVREMRAIGLNPSVDELVAMKVQGISPEYVREMRAIGLNPSVDELVAMKVQGISPEYVRDIRAAGLNPSLDQFIALKVQGVTVEYVKSLRDSGLKNLSTDQYIAAKVQGITPEFVEKVRSHGFNNLSLDKLLALKYAGVF